MVLESRLSCVGQRKVFTTPLLTEVKKRRNTNQFTKKKSRCQRGGVRGMANQNTSPKRATLQTKRHSNDEAVALRKTMLCEPNHCYAVSHCSRPRGLSRNTLTFHPGSRP